MNARESSLSYVGNDDGSPFFFFNGNGQLRLRGGKKGKKHLYLETKHTAGFILLIGF